MKGKPQQWGRTASWPWHAGFCLLLAFLLLYNPFMALHSTHRDYSVHNLQRNRATVGASELQHYGFVQKETQPTDLIVEENREEVAAPAGSYVARGFEREEEVPQPDFSAEVWSRPPPAE